MTRLRSTFLHDNWHFAEKSWQEQVEAGAVVPPLTGGRFGYSRLEWLPARVPGHVHLDLIDNGVIGHPFERLQELGCQWVDEKDWTYRTHFEWQPDHDLPQRMLRFEGLDTICSVHLNDVEIGRHDNMFVPLELDVTHALKAGENTLRVEFESAVRVGNARRAAYFEAEEIPVDCERFEERAFVRKVQCMFGWDWGPRLVSAGIWRPVELIEYQARIGDVHVTQEHRPDGSVAVLAKSTVPAGTRILHVWEGRPAAADGCVVELERPDLWQPHGLGEQRLCTLTSYLLPDAFSVASLPRDTDAAAIALETAALDVRSQRIGLRRLQLVRKPDRFGESFEFEANGRRFYAFGANWIPAHSFPSTITRAALRTHLLAARRAGMNMLRVWGGGLYESDDFYELCDELGMLVWQDFPFACSYYPDGPAERAQLTAEAKNNIVRLRQHASLALWCGNNENLQMFQQRWGDRTRHPRRFYGEVLFEQTLRDLVSELDPGRAYTPTSPHGGDDCQSGGIGDQHYWDVWHGRGDWTHYRDSTARFSSEYGFASAPSWQAFEQIFPPARRSRSPGEAAPVELGQLRGAHRDPIARWHDKTLKGYETFIGYVLLHYPEPATLRDWIYYSQLNQRDALRFAIEHYRRSEFCKGSLIWQFNDCWPVQSWSLQDSLGQPKPALTALARLYAPALISLNLSGDAVELWAILDNASDGAELAGTAKLRAVSLRDGRSLGQWSAEARVALAERKALLTADIASLPREETLLFAELGPLHAWCLLAEPKDLRLPPPEPLRVSLEGNGYLTLHTRGPVVDLWLSDDSGALGFAQNLFTVPAATITRVAYSGSGHGLTARSLAGDHAVRVTEVSVDASDA